MATAAESEPTAPPEPRAKPPFLRRVRIQNYKSIAFCDVVLGPLTVLVGRNGSGKSNFLDALSFVRDIFATNLTEATQRHGGWESILCRAVPADRVSLVLELAVAGAGTAAERDVIAEYGFTLKAGPFGPPVFHQEWMSSGGPGGSAGPRFRRSGEYDYLQKAVRYSWTFDHPDIPCDRVPPPHPDRPWPTFFAAAPFSSVAEALRWLASYNFNPASIRRPPTPSTPGSLLDSDGRNLADAITAVRKDDPDTVDRIQQFLAVVVPEVERFETPGREIIRFYVRCGGGRPAIDFGAESMSDGTLRALAALTAVYQAHRPTGPHLVGIEEPETALHPAAANALVGALDEATLSTQVVITTHSADLLDHPAISPENVRVVQMVDGRTVIGTVDEASREIVKDGLNTLGGLERGDTLDIDADDLDRQLELSRIGAGPPR